MEYPYIIRLREAMAGKYSQDYIENCAAYAEGLLKKGLPVIYDKRHIGEILALHRVKQDAYDVYFVRGRHKERKITAPSLPLKRRQQWILKEILEKLKVHDCCHGFVKGRSILTNAQMHRKHPVIFNMDIEDFFPSVTMEKVRQVFLQAGYSRGAADALAGLCCHEDVLPQGAPTSPYMANLVLWDMDTALAGFCGQKGITYTRYADDMSFSGDMDVEQHGAALQAIVRSFGFSINEEKTRCCRDPHRKMVTGLVVKAEGIFVPKGFKRKLRQEIYYCRRFGVECHLKNTGNSERSSFKEYLYGKAYFVAMVEPVTGRKFLQELDELSWGY